jgi:hypothetical protein
MSPDRNRKDCLRPSLNVRRAMPQPCSTSTTSAAASAGARPRHRRRSEMCRCARDRSPAHSRSRPHAAVPLRVGIRRRGRGSHSQSRSARIPPSGISSSRATARSAIACLHRHLMKWHGRSAIAPPTAMLRRPAGRDDWSGALPSPKTRQCAVHPADWIRRRHRHLRNIAYYLVVLRRLAAPRIRPSTRDVRIGADNQQV